MIIDVHAHLGQWRDRKYDPQFLRDYARECEVKRLLTSHISAADGWGGGCALHEPEANAETLAAAGRHPAVAPLYIARPGQLDSNLHAMAGALAREPFVGVVFAPGPRACHWEEATLEKYLHVTAAAGCPAVFLIDNDPKSRPKFVYSVAKQHPDLDFVMCGLSDDFHRSEALDMIQRSKQREDASLFLDTSHVSAEDALKTVALVGAEHVVFGSDAAAEEGHAAATMQVLDRLRDELDPGDFERVTCKNAQRLFRLSQ